MDHPLNGKPGGGVRYSPAVYLGLRLAEERIAQSNRDAGLWMLKSRIAFIYDKLHDQHPTLFQTPVPPGELLSRLA